VPTLLAMMNDDIPTLRLLIVGGEACPDDLVRRWHRPGRRMVNTYGPTEATVIATFADCRPDRPVTIGRPLPNYSAYVLDCNRRPVEEGETGELYLGGVGLARGYVGRPDLTRERFIASPFPGHGSATRLYRTGDLARFDADGNIEFLGRADGQIKLRGFRVELSEIEAALLKCPGVQSAACTVHELAPGLAHLVAYIVSHNRDELAPERIRAELRTGLPAYMIPTIIEAIPMLPTLASGKVDRQALPAPRIRPEDPAADSTARTAGERKLLAVWKNLLAPMPVTVNDDFFSELGGHSLLAARMVSELRTDPQFARLSMMDVYNDPTIEKLAARFPDAPTTEPAVAEPRESALSISALPPDKFAAVSAVRHFLCGLAQAAGLYFILGFFALQWLTPYLTYTWMIEEDFNWPEAVLGALGSLIVVYPVMLALAVVVKWTVMGRYKPGSYPLWGVFYFRWWFVNSILSIVPVDYLAGTPLLGLYYRLLGARIGRNVHLATDMNTAFDLVSIGDDSSVGTDAALLAHTVKNCQLILAPITIGKRCFVGNRAIVAGGTQMANDAQLEDLSLLPGGESIPIGETWRGSPAKRVGLSAPDPEPIARPSPARRFVFGILHGIGALLVPVFVICAIFPGMMLMHYLNLIDDYYYYLVLAPLVAVSFGVFLSLEIAAFKWLLLGRVRAGRYSLFSGFYLRKRFVDQLMELSLDVLSPLYSTIYLAPWYRMLGARLGKRAEISTASFISPDLLSIDDEGFIADCVSLGAARVKDNTLTIARNHVGRRSFVGNSAVLPPGTVVGDDCLIGCLSSPPPGGQAARRGTSWLGSPGFFLPQREKNAEFSEETTFRPTVELRLQRAAIEFFRVILPSTGFICLTSVLLSAVILIRDAGGDALWLPLFPLLYTACGMTAAAAVIALKWILLGRFRPGEKPLWSTFVWRNELVTALHENLTDPFLIDKLQGTPFIAWFFRLLGAKIGKRAFIETTCFTEYDLVHIGDDVALNVNATVQTHLFEDRVMKMSEIHIGDRCSVGALSLVLYDTIMESGSSLGDLSLLMKNELLPSGTSWEGIPARPVDEPGIGQSAA
jgi:non-ribosomal peptide synthetase-like protein